MAEEVVTTNKGIIKLKGAINLILDGVERVLLEAKDGNEIIAEAKDIDITEAIELGMLLFQRIPGLLAAYKSE